MTEPFQPPAFVPLQPAVPPQPSVPTRKGPILWVLASVSAVLLVGTGVLGYLWSAENTSSRSELDAKDSQIEELKSRIDDLETSNERREHDIDDLKDDLTTNQGVIEDLTACPAKVQTYLDAIGGSEAVLMAAIDEMVDSCHIG